MEMAFESFQPVSSLSHSAVVLLTETVSVLLVLRALKLATNGVIETSAFNNIGPRPDNLESIYNNPRLINFDENLTFRDEMLPFIPL